MPAKGAKCCCCIGGCVHIGSRFTACPVCTESPVEWFIESFTGAISRTASQVGPVPMFGCCLNVTFDGISVVVVSGITGRLLQNSRFSGVCRWIGTNNICESGAGDPRPGSHFEMEILGTAPGEVIIRLIWDDYKVAAWVNKDPWLCLCKNKFIRFPYLDEGDPDELAACGTPEELCVVPVPPCCPSRLEPLPRTLYATLTALNECPCLDGVVVPLEWDPDDGDGKWVSAPGAVYGTCYGGGCDDKIRLWCNRLTGQSITTWQYSVDNSDDNFGVPITGSCEPLLLAAATGFFKTCCGSVNSGVHITFHE